ncbi:MAG: glutamine-hydrolyzing carbamoyl-phosphate synthase small subunit [Pseudomonadota bacterium]|nr:glutamine-hydrolyzing carbamoyl-phosphate synthase small subunit [Pseudomonadota bacterium]
MTQPALLALEDGSLFPGISLGAEGVSAGEVVFNTAMTGYQEILTDPSYAQQIVTLTYPQIGNTGCNAEDSESDRVWAAGLVIRQGTRRVSNFRAEESLEAFLLRQGVVAIADVDTRRLTRHIREQGALSGVIIAGEGARDGDAAIAQARAFPGLKGADLAKVVSRTSQESWAQGVWRLGQGLADHSGAERPFKVVAYDFGVKRNILRLLVDRGCDVTVVPAETPAEAVLTTNPDGVFLSNGPGDPEPCSYAIEAIRQFLAVKMPLFGICLGHQLLALASGAQTLKMRLGHHGANHPVKDLKTGRVMITSQNHGFAVDLDSLPPHLEATHLSLFDGTLQGLAHREAPAFGFQGHPEASPGPQDAEGLFDRFAALMTEARRARGA